MKPYWYFNVDEDGTFMLMSSDDTHKWANIPMKHPDDPCPQQRMIGHFLMAVANLRPITGPCSPWETTGSF